MGNCATTASDKETRELRARAECVGVELRFHSTPFPVDKLEEIERRESMELLSVNVIDVETHSHTVVEHISPWEKARTSLRPWAEAHGMVRVGSVHFAGEEVRELTWEELSIESGATVMAAGISFAVWAKTASQRKVAAMVIDALWATNPGVPKRALCAGLEWEGNSDVIQKWDLQKLGHQPGRLGGLVQLPDEFGSLQIRGDLCLNGNALTSLPATFASITVGGSLYLSDNQLDSLPGNIGALTVGGGLYLSRNLLTAIPPSIGSLHVGGNFSLDENQLNSLPPSLDGARIGGHLALYGNPFLEPPPTQLPQVVGHVLLLKPGRRTTAAEMGIPAPTPEKVDVAKAKALGLLPGAPNGRRRTFGQAARAIAAASRGERATQ